MSDTTAIEHETTHQETHDDHAEGHGHGHAVPFSLLVGVFAILMFLTFVTVAITTFDFGYQMNLVVAMGIALVKAAFVGLYFMHLRWDAPLNGFILVASLLFVTLFITITLMDSGQYATFQEAAAVRNATP